MDLEADLKRWTDAGLLDSAAAGRILEFENSRLQPKEGLRWPVIFALVFGALLLGAGVLLFVSAHWDELSPGARFALVLAMVAIFHVAGAFTSRRFEALSISLHTLGTITLGAGIAPTGQIFHLSEHWPSAILLWALGAGAAWVILRHWTEAALFAILFPAWICAEWLFRAADPAPVLLVCSLSLTYLSLLRSPGDPLLYKALAWIGGLIFLPSAAILAASSGYQKPSWHNGWIGWTIGLLAPFLLAVAIRRQAAVWNLIAGFWVLLLSFAPGTGGERPLVYPVCALGAVGLVAWGVYEHRAERVNLGMAGFALTVLVFYFSDVMDKLDRSFSLILLGCLFLGGGWVLERLRRRLVADL